MDINIVSPTASSSLSSICGRAFRKGRAKSEKRSNRNMLCSRTVVQVFVKQAGGGRDSDGSETLKPVGPIYNVGTRGQTITAGIQMQDVVDGQKGPHRLRD